MIDLVLIGGLLVALVSNVVLAALAFAVFTIAVSLLGRLPFREVLGLLSDPALVAVVCLFLFSTVLDRLPWLREVLFASHRPKGVRRILLRFLGITTALSSVMPNTAVVGALLGPALNQKTVSPHVLLMPLSFAALAGGMVTSFGTSANLVVTSQAANYGVRLSFMDFFWPGLLTATMVLVALVLLVPRLLPVRNTEADNGAESYHLEGRIPKGSPLAGKSLAENQLRSLQRFFIAEVQRGERLISPVEPDEVLQEGDILVFVGDVRDADDLTSIKGLELLGGKTRHHTNVVHAVVAAHSALAGSTLKDARFRSTYDASVLGIRRGDEPLSGKLGLVELRAGDLLVMATGPNFQDREDLKGQLHIVEVVDPWQLRLPERSALAASLVFGLFVVSAASETIDFTLSTLLLVAVAILAGWINRRDVTRLFPVDLTVILWGSLVLGVLISKSGFAALAAQIILQLLPSGSVLLALIVMFIVTWVLTELLSNTAAALAALPIALELALKTGGSPLSFALIVAFGASASFLMPFGYQTHLMVMAPGRYTLLDFVRLGLPIVCVYAIASIAGVYILT